MALLVATGCTGGQAPVAETAPVDADFAKGYADTSAKIRKATPAEREENCRALEEMHKRADKQPG